MRGSASAPTETMSASSATRPATGKSIFTSKGQTSAEEGLEGPAAGIGPGASHEKEGEDQTQEITIEGDLALETSTEEGPSRGKDLQGGDRTRETGTPAEGQTHETE